MDIWANSAGRHARIVVSGGQGPDEMVTEASAMRAWLIAAGVPDDAVLTEDRATTTMENLSLSKAMLDHLTNASDRDDNPQGYTCLYVTNDFHLLRCGIYSRLVGLATQGVGCPTVAYYLPGAFAREYFAVIYLYRWVFIVWVALCVVVALSPLAV